MKKRVSFLISAVLLLSACGTTARYSSAQRFQDGIYYSKADAAREIHIEVSDDAKIDTLVAQTKSSGIYLLGDDTKTVTVPESKSATIRLTGNSGTSVIIEDTTASNFTITFNSDPDPWYYTSIYWDPWYYGSWRWYRPWHYSSWYWWNDWWYDSWYWGWASPNCDPWYWGG